MTPVDLGQYTPNRPGGTRFATGGDSARFDDLLAQVQSLQFSAFANTGMVQTMTPDETADPSGGSTGGNAREARINQETQSARQAEVASHGTRGADPSSVQNGVVSERHERVLTQEKLAAEGKPSPEAKVATNSAEAPRTSELLSAAAAGESKPVNEKNATQVTSQPSASHQPVASSETTTSNHQQQPGAESGTDRSNSNTAPSKAISVPTTGAAAAASADQASGKQASPAQRIGEILAGKTSGQVTRTSGTEVQTQVGKEPTAKNATLNQSAKVRTNGQPQGRATAEGPEQTKRSEFENLIKSIRLNRGTKSSSATIRLNPPELGKMKIHAQMSDSVLRVRVEASSSEARHLLNERSSELLNALRERGIDVDRFEVVRPESDRADFQQGNGQGANVADQSLAAQGDGRQAADTNTGNDRDVPQSFAGQEESPVQNEIAPVAHDARLDVLV